MTMPQSNNLSQHPVGQTGEESVPHDTGDQQACLSPLSSRQHNKVGQHKRARDSQVSQAERMVKQSRVDLKAGEVGNNVAIPIPTVDRGRGDPRNILGVIVDHNENYLYRIAVEDAILKNMYSRNEFD